MAFNQELEEKLDIETYNDKQRYVENLMIDIDQMRRLNATSLRKSEALKGSNRGPSTQTSPNRTMTTTSISQRSWVNPRMHNYAKHVDVKLNNKLLHSSFAREKSEYRG